MSEKVGENAEVHKCNFLVAHYDLAVQYCTTNWGIFFRVKIQQKNVFSPIFGFCSIFHIPNNT